ncbi:hypothetical protein EDD22DRAFT_982495 [Suillus occidentalis]|nr:hypothetical protein EDD22DRAFT_982495 [Suillus occidentalis]
MAWYSQMPDLTQAFLQWKHNQGLACLCPDPIEENNECQTMVAFQITTVNITIDGSGHADERCFTSSYLISADEVKQFKDDVHLHPGTHAAAAHKAVNMIAENTTNVFEQTDIFVSACHHGIIQTLVEMRQSGELYLIDVYGPNGVTDYDIGCSFSKTVAASSIANKVKRLNHCFIYHTLYQEGLGIEDLETCERVFSGSNAVTPLIHHASYFHWLQFIDLQFDQRDQDRYQELSKSFLDLTDADFQCWNVEELEYLTSLASEVEYDPQKTAYVEALQSLMMAKAEYGGVTSIQFLSYVPANFTQNSGLRKGPQLATRAQEVEC